MKNYRIKPSYMGSWMIQKRILYFFWRTIDICWKLQDAKSRIKHFQTKVQEVDY